MKYGVVEIFKTLQGEGYHAGTPAVFLRLAGCNMWSGNASDRARDAVRNEAKCPLWCDTDFIVREKLSPVEILERLKVEAGPIRFIVITGGEPFLQLEQQLVTLLRDYGFYISVETNGTVEPKVEVDWVTCSPKQSPERIRLQECHELKVVFPAYDPLEYRINAGHRYIQPLANTSSVGRSVIDQTNTANAIQWLMTNPDWKLSVQTHKVLGLP